MAVLEVIGFVMEFTIYVASRLGTTILNLAIQLVIESSPLPYPSPCWWNLCSAHAPLAHSQASCLHLGLYEGSYRSPR